MMIASQSTTLRLENRATIKRNTKIAQPPRINIQGSFSLFLQNWTRITELRSIYKRLSEFEKAIGFNKKTTSRVRSKA